MFAYNCAQYEWRFNDHSVVHAVDGHCTSSKSRVLRQYGHKGTVMIACTKAKQKGNRETERLRCLTKKMPKKCLTLRSFQLAMLRNETSWTYCVVAPASPFDLHSSVSIFGVGATEDNVELYDNMFGVNSETYQVLSLCILEVCNV